MDFDSTVPPGGEGKITLKLNLKGYQGDIKKTATVFSNDPQNGKLILVMQGRVKSLIEVRPGGTIAFRGLADQIRENVLEITATHPHKFQIKRTETNLEGKIAFAVETVQPGTQYKLKISNQAKQGSYTGFIKLYTDLPQSQDVLIRVSGYIEGDISVKPQTLVVGRLAAQHPLRVGKVLVTNNRGKPFKLTGVTYDEQLIRVSQEALPKDEGYSLEVTANVDRIASGARQQTVLTIETDAVPSEKYQVQVHVMNAAEPSPSASANPAGAGGSQAKAPAQVKPEGEGPSEGNNPQ